MPVAKQRIVDNARSGNTIIPYFLKNETDSSEGILKGKGLECCLVRRFALGKAAMTNGMAAKSSAVGYALAIKETPMNDADNIIYSTQK